MKDEKVKDEKGEPQMGDASSVSCWRISYKWWALALLWVAFFLQQGTRQIFGATLTSIQGALGIDPAQIGLVATVFTFAYGICVPFAGATADVLNRKWMIVSGVFVFCLGIFVSGFVAGAGMLLVTYGLVNGIGQSFYYPSATSVIGQLHKETRATALSILQMGLYAGIIGCSAASGWFAEGGADGWRIPFKVFGGLGLVWAVALAFFLKDTRPEPAKAEAAVAKPSLKEAFMVFLSNPCAVLLALALGMMIYVDVGFKTWMPAHLQSAFGVAKGQAAFHAVLWHYLGAFVGVTIGGRVSDRLAARRPGVRMETNMVGLAFAAPFIVWMAFAPSLAACCAAMALFGVFRGIYDSNLMASLFDLIPSRYHASGAGIMLAFGFVFGSTSPVVLGLMKNHFASSVGLASLAAFYLLGAAFVLAARLKSRRMD